MNRNGAHFPATDERVPRMRGDEPDKGALAAGIYACSPHARG